MLDNADLRGVSRLYKLSQVGTGGDPPLSHLAFGPRSCASHRHVVAALPQASTKAIDLPAYGTSTWSSNACEKHAYGDTRRRLCYAEAHWCYGGQKRWQRQRPGLWGAISAPSQQTPGMDRTK